MATIRIGLVLLACLQVGPTRAVDPLAEELLVTHNRERAKEGKKPLVLSRALCESARLHARDMADHKMMNHTGSDGSDLPDRIKRQGYRYLAVAENIAMGQADVEAVTTAWMDSPGHRKNILSYSTEMGAACLVDVAGKKYWCVNFGTPTPMPTPDEAASGLVKALNRDRAANHRPGVKAESGLERAAMTIAAELATRQELKLDKDPYATVKAEGFEGRDIYIVFCSNAMTPELAMQSLVGSKGDELNDYREVGIGYARSKGEIPYWCAVFVKPLPKK